MPKDFLSLTKSIFYFDLPSVYELKTDTGQGYFRRREKKKAKNPVLWVISLGSPFKKKQ